MTVSPAEQVFEEILPYLEILDAQIGGVIQLLKDKGITTTEEFAKYVQRADRASNVRDLGLRVRMEYLFSSATKRAHLRNLVVPSKLGPLAYHSLLIDERIQTHRQGYSGRS